MGNEEKHFQQAQIKSVTEDLVHSAKKPQNKTELFSPIFNFRIKEGQSCPNKPL